jgi:hypothetical protein
MASSCLTSNNQIFSATPRPRRNWAGDPHRPRPADRQLVRQPEFVAYLQGAISAATDPALGSRREDRVLSIYMSFPMPATDG